MIMHEDIDVIKEAIRLAVHIGSADQQLAPTLRAEYADPSIQTSDDNFDDVVGRIIDLVRDYCPKGVIPSVKQLAAPVYCDMVSVRWTYTTKSGRSYPCAIEVWYES